MVRRPELFLDTSALFAGVWSSEGGGRLLLKLGEAGVIKPFASSQVVSELERTVGSKAPHQLANLAVLLDRSGIEVVGSPPRPLIETCQRLTKHENDGLVLAAAWFFECDYFVTLDKRHFLDSAPLQSAAPFPLGTPGDCLVWLRRTLIR